MLRVLFDRGVGSARVVRFVLLDDQEGDFVEKKSMEER